MVYTTIILIEKTKFILFNVRLSTENTNTI
nr:MAG TPA: hypothetical protein [Caudoviricetes sp.]